MVKQTKETLAIFDHCLPVCVVFELARGLLANHPLILCQVTHLSSIPCGWCGVVVSMETSSTCHVLCTLVHPTSLLETYLSLSSHDWHECVSKQGTLFDLIVKPILVPVYTEQQCCIMPEMSCQLPQVRFLTFCINAAPDDYVPVTLTDSFSVNFGSDQFSTSITVFIRDDTVF